MSTAEDRALSFGHVAERYERYRPGYPDSVVDLLLEDGARTAVEIGAGTGKATRAVAARGVAVLAVEPDPGMCAVLRRTTAGLPVTVVQSTLEDLGPQPPVDLLFSAAAWHWTDPATRWQRAADVLRPSGTFACLGGPVDVADEALAAAIEEVRAASLGSEEVAGAENDPVSGALWPLEELRASPLFTDVREDDLTSTFPMSADHLVGLMSTVSAFLVRSEAERDDLLARIRALLPDPVLVSRPLMLHRARRSGS